MRRERGYTLIELLVALAVLALSLERLSTRWRSTRGMKLGLAALAAIVLLAGIFDQASLGVDLLDIPSMVFKRRVF